MEALIQFETTICRQFETESRETTEETTFGILTVSTMKMELPKEDVQANNISILMTLDISQSMNESDHNAMSKIKQLKQTMMKLIDLFSAYPHVRLAVELFNETTQTLFGFEEKEVNEQKRKIKNIKTDGSTNIELALKNANKIMCLEDKNNENNDDVSTNIHIMLTDGEATEGEQKNEILMQFANTHYRNVFIGFGKHHNSCLLDALSSVHKNEYWFVDNIKNTGMICGEIVHSILYPHVEEVIIQVKHGEIYNWKTNEWSCELEIPYIPLLTEKTFHVRTANKEGFRCKIENIYNCVETKLSVDVLPDLIGVETGEIVEVNLQKYWFRQNVLEILYDSKTNPKSIKERANTLYNEIKHYVESTPSPCDVVFLKCLMDDLYVVYMTCNTQYGHMFSVARQTTNARQHTYNATDIDVNDYCVVDAINTAKILYHEIGNSLETPYSNDEIIKTIKRLI